MIAAWAENEPVYISLHDIVSLGLALGKKQGPTWHRPMDHPLVLRYLSYSTTLAEHVIHLQRQCPALAGLGHVCLCLFS